MKLNFFQNGKDISFDGEARHNFNLGRSYSLFMILTNFPDLRWLKEQAERSFEDQGRGIGKNLPTKGWPNVILNVSSSETFRDNIRGPLSLFTNLSGESTVVTSGRRVPVQEDFFFLTNHDQYYTLEIKQKKPTETFNIHFGEYFCDEVFDSLSSSADQLLENHFRKPIERLEFHNKLYYRDLSMGRIIMEIKNQTHLEASWLEEKLFALIEQLLKNEKDLLRIRSRLPLIKSSTRAEILKRLLVVSDYIHAHLQGDLSLEELARVACLSKFHFLRLFKIAFDKTPYQFINEERVRKGQKLLRKSNLEVHEIAHVLGFNNSSSFSRMFYNQTGTYPTQLRQSAF